MWEAGKKGEFKENRLNILSDEEWKELTLDKVKNLNGRKE